MTDSPRAALWLRVSTDEQHTENQRPLLEQMAKRRGFEVVRVYECALSAWTGKHQAVLDEAMLDAHRGEYETLFVWAIDRVSREGIEATFRTVRQFADRGVTIVSHEEPWLNGSSDVQELMLAISAWMARKESDRRSARIRAGLARRKAEGGHVGRKAGAKDVKKRKRSGYVARYERETV